MPPTQAETPHQFIQRPLSLDESETFNFSVMRALHEASPDGILVVNDQLRVVSLNRRFLEIWKLEELVATRPQSQINGLADEPILNAVLNRVNDSEGFLKRVRELYADHHADDHCELSLKDGRTLERYSTAIRAEDGSYLGRVWFFRDITPRRQLEVELRNSQQRVQAAAQATQDGMITVDSRGIVHFWNPAAQRILGYAASEIVGKKLHEVLAPPCYHESIAAGWSQFVVTGEGAALKRTCEFSARRRDGVEIPIELSVAPMNVNGEWWAFGILRDISQRKQAEERVAWLARNDALTGLPNRAVFADLLRDAIAQSARGAGPLAVLYLDLDHFKDINDTLGHSAGDWLLREVAGRLRRALRNVDKVARLGGDEFAILATQTDPDGAAALASKIIAAIKFPFLLGDNKVRTAISIGIARLERQDEPPETLMGKADLALYRAKAEGRSTFRFFTDAMHSEMCRRVGLLADLEQALKKNELFLVYQPEVELATGKISALEALVRWRHPQRGTILPSEFIPLAENSGLMVALGRWVLRAACRQARHWLDQGIQVPVIAVNVSPMQLKGPTDFSVELARLLRQHRISPRQLEIELTEATLIDAWQRNSDLVRKLQELGISIAIDDFGTGYSSLEYLRRFPGCRIKVAQTFLKDVPHDPSSRAIIRAAIGLGRELGREVIAEGVETREQLELLKLWGCQEGQGYHFAKPLLPEDAADFLQTHCAVVKKDTSPCIPPPGPVTRAL